MSRVITEEESKEELKFADGELYITDIASNIDKVEQDIQWHSPARSPESLFCSIITNNNSRCLTKEQSTVPQHTEENIDVLAVSGRTYAKEERAPKQMFQDDIALANGDDYYDENEFLEKSPPLQRKTLSHKKKLMSIENNQWEQPVDKLEDNSTQVKARFKRGCECYDESCFLDLNVDSVFKHRLNIAELTKSEHDMYLMGITMASLSDPHRTLCDKERRRMRAQYVYQGRRVCLQAFLYLENCSHYQLKRIRKHVMVHGVAPRVHGNHGKKPHNTFTLDTYKYATGFIKRYLHQQTPGGHTDGATIQLPIDVTCKALHDAYCEYGAFDDPDNKVMSYSTFRQFLKMQFPNVKFRTFDGKYKVSGYSRVPEVESEDDPPEDPQSVFTDEHHSMEQLMLLDGAAPQTQLVISNIPAHATADSNACAVTYQLTTAGYVITDQGNIVTTGLMNN